MERMERMLNLSLRDFSKAVASDSFAPGGGCVSALSGALSASLAQMVLTLTIGKKKYAEFDNDNKNLLEQIKKHSEILLDCIERDAAGCARIMEAMALPKDTEPERARRKAAMSEASKRANEAPMDVCEKALTLLRTFKTSLNKINRNTITDWACGAMQAYAALEGAAMNAKINCSSIEDAKYRKDVEIRCRTMLGDGRAMLEEIRNQVHSSLDASN